MASPILDTLMSAAGPILGKVAGQLGESPQSVSTGMKSGISAILAGLVSKAGDSGVMNQVAQAATSIDPNIALSDPGALVQSSSTSATSPLGGLLSMLFGGSTSGIADMIAKASGMRSSSASSLLTMAIPLVLGFLKKQSGGNLSAASLSSTLMSQRDSILADAPAGLGSLLGIGGLGAAASGAVAGARSGINAAENSVRAAAANVQAPGRNWLWPVLGVLALVVLGWLFFGRNKSSDTATAVDSTTSTISGAVETTATDTTATDLRAAADSAGAAIGSAVSGAVANLGAFVKRTLPGNVELNVPENGVESNLLSFITDANRPVNDTTWFNFDRILFESGSSRLAPQSKEQVDNIAAILKAYPAVKIKLGGYTDNVGDAAANLKLSGDRANTVKADLVSRGIATDRISAEGYGAAHPVADNSTPEGREQNRRIAIRVTQK